MLDLSLINLADLGIILVESIVDFKIFSWICFVCICFGYFGVCVQGNIAKLSQFIQYTALHHVSLHNHKVTPIHSTNQPSPSQR